MSSHDAESCIRVFLVDDHPTILWGLETLIESASPRMTLAGSASNLDQMFASLATARPDVILLDLDLDGANSLGCIEDLAQRTAAQVLIFTGSGDTELHERAVVRGARGVVHKQQCADLLLRAIEKVHGGELWLDRVTLGRVMTTLARGPLKDPEAIKIGALTPKERQIVVTVVREKGARNKLVAEKLHMSEHTLRNHLTTIYSKLEVSGRMDLYLYASAQRQLSTP